MLEDHERLEIIYQDEYLVAINKPHGLFVHRTNWSAPGDQFALQLLRDQIGQKVYPVHRLDRKTSGVLLFTKDKASLKEINSIFQERKVKKVYKALVRGFTEHQGRIDYALTSERGTQEAQSNYKAECFFELPWPFGGHSTSRYTLLELVPETGRFHQLRKHMAHIFHPIIGDRPHGCNKQNRLWKSRRGLVHMLLHAESLSFNFRDNSYSIQADLSPQFSKELDWLTNYKLK